MKRLSTGLTLGLALLALGTEAQASDFGYRYDSRGAKDYGPVGTPVPAPIPVPETFRWYLRGDIGIGTVQKPSIGERGMEYGATDGDPATTPFGMSSSWFQGDFKTFIQGGVGVGAYFSPRLRGDVTLDVRTRSKVDTFGTYSYAEWTHVPLPGAPTGNTVNGTTGETTELRSTMTLANLYYDFTDRGAGFTPYVGIGAGFAVRELDRRSTTTEEIVDGTGAAVGERTYTGSGKAHVIVPAAAATAGVAYALSAGVVLDFNYRFTYMGAADFSTAMKNSTGDTIAKSVMSIGDTYEHTLRAGLRWNVW